MVGGLVRWALEQKKNMTEKAKKDMVENGVLYCSGLIAGEGLVGILLAVFALIPNTAYGTLGDFLAAIGSGTPINSNIGGLVFFAILTFTLLQAVKGKKK